MAVVSGGPDRDPDCRSPDSRGADGFFELPAILAQRLVLVTAALPFLRNEKILT
jgi:hypothetical protein